MWQQAIQYGQQRHKDMLIEAEKQRMLAKLRQHKDSPLRRVLAAAGQILVAVGKALTPATPPKTEPRVWTDS
jgi:hypothetical protein